MARRGRKPQRAAIPSTSHLPDVRPVSSLPPEIAEVVERIEPLDRAAMEAARARQDRLTKPPGSLGRLERLAVQIAGITGRPRPRLEQKVVVIMAADHGVA